MEHRANVRTARFSGDSRRIITLVLQAGLIGEAHVWDTSTGRQVLIGNRDGSVQPWNTITGEKTGAPIDPGPGGARSSFSADASRVLLRRSGTIAIYDGTARVWHSEIGRELILGIRRPVEGLSSDWGS